MFAERFRVGTQGEGFVQVQSEAIPFFDQFGAILARFADQILAIIHIQDVIDVIVVAGEFWRLARQYVQDAMYFVVSYQKLPRQKGFITHISGDDWQKRKVLARDVQDAGGGYHGQAFLFTSFDDGVMDIELLFQVFQLLSEQGVEIMVFGTTAVEQVERATINLGLFLRGHTQNLTTERCQNDGQRFYCRQLFLRIHVFLSFVDVQWLGIVPRQLILAQFVGNCQQDAHFLKKSEADIMN